MCSLVICMVCGVCIMFFYFFFFKQKTAYEMRISDWSSDVCSSDLGGRGDPRRGRGGDVRYRDRRLQDRDSRAAPARRWIGNEPKIGRASCRERVCQYV